MRKTKRLTIGGCLFIAVAILMGIPSCIQTSGPGPAPQVSFRRDATAVTPMSVSELKKKVGFVSLPLASGSNLRQKWGNKMNPRYITIHSTQNRSAGSIQHAQAMANNRIPHVWHLTIDQNMTAQHIPFTETGRHADSGRTGDQFSIGIEMCEKSDHYEVATLARTARVCAYLMYKYDIPLRNVVPHYYWTRKNCPIILMDSGRPGFKWSWFISRVDYYYRCINGGQSKS